MANLQATIINGTFKLGTTADTSTEGNMWYDTSTNTVKYSGLVGAMSAGGNTPFERFWTRQMGQQNAGLLTGGVTPGFGCFPTCTQEYNGSSWSGGGNALRSNYGMNAVGQQNSGLTMAGACGGTCTQEYNGSSWAYGGAFLYNEMQQGAAGGEQNSAFAGAGIGCDSKVAEYNGSSWSTGGTLSVPRTRVVGTGQQNAGMVSSGRGATVACNEEYNGTSFSTGGDLIAAAPLGAGFGEQNSANIFGSTGSKYNGTSWSAIANPPVTIDLVDGAGNSSSGFISNLNANVAASRNCTIEYTESLSGISL